MNLSRHPRTDLLGVGRWSCPTTRPAIEGLAAQGAGTPAGSSPAPQAAARSGRLEAGGAFAQPARRLSIPLAAALGVLAGCALAAPAAAQGLAAPAATAPPQAASIAALITEAAQRFRLPQAWIVAVMRAESAFNPRATSPKGAMGLMQLMPDTWAAMRAELRLGNDPYDPHDNILAGAGYLRGLYDRFGAGGFLAAYNAGPGRYLDYVVGGRALAPETRRYVAVLAPVIGETQAVFPFTGGGSAAPLPPIRDTLFAPVVGTANAAAIGSPPPEPAPGAPLKPAHGSHDGLFAGAWSKAQP